LKKSKVEKVVHLDTGEYAELKTFKTVQPYNNKPFIKLYKGAADLIFCLNKPEQEIMKYIFNNLKPYQKLIKVHKTFFTLSKSAYNRALNSVIEKQLIFKSDYPFLYEINKEMFFNGKY